MNDLEKYIIDHKAEFNTEAQEGHLERFEAKLQQRKGIKRRSLVRSTMRVASVAVLLIMSGLYLNSRFFGDADEQELHSNQEFIEAQYYYKTQISDGINSIKSMDGGMDATQRKQLVKEMSEADAYFEELQKDFKATPDDPRVIEALLNHYKTKAMIISNIVNELDAINTKQKAHNTNIKL